MKTPKGLRKVWARPLVDRYVNPYLDMCLMRVVEQLNPAASGSWVVAREGLSSASPLKAVQCE